MVESFPMRLRRHRAHAQQRHLHAPERPMMTPHPSGYVSCRGPFSCSETVPPGHSPNSLQVLMVSESGSRYGTALRYRKRWSSSSGHASTLRADLRGADKSRSGRPGRLGSVSGEREGRQW
jgi:hypothetical protein